MQSAWQPLDQAGKTVGWRSRCSKASRAKVMHEVDGGQPRWAERRVEVLGKMASAQPKKLERSRDGGTDGALTLAAHRKLWVSVAERRKVFGTDSANPS